MNEIEPEEHQRLWQSQLDGITRGSMVKIIAPEKRVWYWVII